jgi:serine/threonine-protein phosphatase 5
VFRCAALADAVRAAAKAAILAGPTAKADVPVADVVRLLEAARAASLKLPNVAVIPAAEGSETVVCGDVHGQGRDFLSIFERFGDPTAARPFLFNGDLVDRGPHSNEIALTLASLVVDRPGALWVNRGNHETPDMYFRYGFAQELLNKYGRDHADSVEQAFRGWFNALPVAHVVDSRVFVVHGGVPKKRDATISDINALNRDAPRPPPMLDQMLWSDPIPDGAGRGAAFHAADTVTFLKAVNCEFMLRSHEVKDAGYELHHGGKCATVFSAPKYCGVMKNLGAVAIVKHGAVGTRPEFVQFPAAA